MSEHEAKPLTPAGLDALRALAITLDEKGRNDLYHVSAQAQAMEDARSIRSLIRAEEERAEVPNAVTRQAMAETENGAVVNHVSLGEMVADLDAEERGKAEAGEWRGDWICESCGTVLPNDKGRDYDFSTKTHLTAESGSYMGHKVCNGKLVPHERRADERRTRPSPDAGLRIRQLASQLAQEAEREGRPDREAELMRDASASLASAPSQGVRE
jgi:hypothetical protein